MQQMMHMMQTGGPEKAQPNQMQQMQQMMQQMMQMMKGNSGGFKTGGKGVIKGNLKAKAKKEPDQSDDPAGSGRVFVRGFDFGTTDEQLEGHMSKAGPIHTVHWVNKGNAVVVYKKKASAVKACSKLDNTTINGNSRYINVSSRD